MAYIADEYDSSKLLLTAINTLLQTINELPIENTDDLINSTTAQLAEMTIMEVKKEVLSQGWNFNTDNNYPFPPDANGYIPVPPNILDIAANSDDVIMREWKLYDRARYSFIFESAVPCTVVWNMSFNSLTHPIRHYITIKSARVFQARTVGDQLSYTYTSKEEEDAYLSARFSESRTGKFNILSSSFGSQNSGLR
jgi:hypothetical protein